MTRVIAHAVQGNLAPLPNVRNVIAVASGKGGVGKSTTAVNVALALARDGARVGILDADVYGPSQPRMLGLLGRHPESLDCKTFEPLVAHGLEANSIGFLIEEERPVICISWPNCCWRTSGTARPPRSSNIPPTIIRHTKRHQRLVIRRSMPIARISMRQHRRTASASSAMSFAAHCVLPIPSRSTKRRRW